MTTEPLLSPDQGDTVVALVGDWHGNIPWAEKTLRGLARAGIRTIYHLGDFGFWPGPSGRKYLNRISRLCTELDITIWVTPGNHEDWPALGRAHKTYGSAPAPMNPRIFALPRGYRWTHAGRSFLSLGGAPSVDYLWRTSGKDWWPEEATTEDEARRVAAGGHAEIMLTHDTPNQCTPAVAAMLHSNPFGFPREALIYSAEGRRVLDIAYAGVRPRLLAHGHYHVQGDATGPDKQRVLSLQKDDEPGNWVTLDLTAEDFDVNWGSMPAPTGTSFGVREPV